MGIFGNIFVVVEVDEIEMRDRRKNGERHQRQRGADKGRLFFGSPKVQGIKMAELAWIRPCEKTAIRGNNGDLTPCNYCKNFAFGYPVTNETPFCICNFCVEFDVAGAAGVARGNFT